MAGRFIDFDAARAERVHEPLTLRAYGKTFALPSEMPAGLYLDILRMESERDSAEEITNSEALRLMRRVFPAAVLDELLQNPDFGLEDFVDLAQMVMAAYQGEEIVPLAEVKPPAPKRTKAQTAGSPAS